MQNMVDEVTSRPHDSTPPSLPPVSDEPGRRRLLDARTRRVLGLLLDAAVVGVVGGVIAAWAAGFRPGEWRYYFNYRNDTFFNALNGALANPLGVTNTTSRLGWPHGLSMTDYPAAEPIFTWFQWFAHRFVGDAFTVLVLMWFLGFVLVASTTYLALRGLKLGRWPSIIVALVYDFVPFHFVRSIDHTNLALYMAVPLAGMLLLWVMTGRLDRPPRSSAEWRPLWRTPDWWVVTASILVIAVSARYYAMFFLMILGVATVGRMLVRHQVRLAWAPAIIVALTVGFSLLTGLPQILQVADGGRNSEVAQRSRTESDFFALRLTDLMAPIPDHRVPELAKVSDSFRRTITRGEDGNSMGFFLLGGLVFAGVVALVRRPRRLSPDHPIDDPVGLATNTAILGVLAFLFGTVGGLGGVVASVGFTQIRAWNRISIYVSFFGAVGLALALSWLWTLRTSTVPWRRWLPVVALPVVLALAVFDQSGTTQYPQSWVAGQRASDRAFFGAMAADLGAGSSVFQLPYVPFPESNSAELDYVGFRGFLSDDGLLNWSFGGMRGRASDWQRTWVTMDMETQVVGLAAAGFDAVLVDRVGYTPQDNPEQALQNLLGPSRGTSADGRFVWFDLRPVHDRLVAAHGVEWVEATGARVVRPIGVQFRADAYRRTGPGAQDWGAIGKSTTIELRRYDDDTGPVDVQLGVGVAPGSHVTATSGSSGSTQTSAGQALEFQFQSSMKPDTLRIHVTTDAPNTATTTESSNDVRGSISELKVLDSTLAQQIARGELTVPPPS
jgi:phosphoglycerol transferase